MNLDHYMFVPYLDKGRTMSGADCWGLVRLVLGREFGIQGLPEFGRVGRKQQAEMTTGYTQTRPLFEPSMPVASAVAAAFDRDGNFVHCGVVVRSGSCLHVLHSTADCGVILERVGVFEQEQHRQRHSVGYYRYVG
jgi:cell wall-associated NlpC family hydrolase